MDINHTMKNKYITETERRLFFLNRAMERAKNPEWKALWKRKKEELLKNL
jgi:hypothetical protein